MAHRVAVIGAGAVGLSAAVNVQQSIPGVEVTIISDKFDENTTSWGAGGIFRLDLDYHPKEDHEKIRDWAIKSWEHYSNLAHSDDAVESGMSFVAGTLLYNVPKDQAYSVMSELTFDFQHLGPDQLKQLNPNASHKYGYSFSTLLTHTGTYLKWLMKQFLNGGGSIQCRKVSSLSELQDDFDIIVNCCGLNASQLCQDKTMFPIMGHLIKIKAPWIKKFFWSEEFYMFPHNNYTLLGGIREKGNWSTVPDPEIRKTILRRGEKFFPHLKDAPILGEWVGLRPGRPSIRLEVELVKCHWKNPLP
ncbi:D-aspartate oxidase-like, partial [Elysia marginata]